MTQTKLEKVISKAKKLKLPSSTIMLSTRKDKKFKVLLPNNKWIHFGSTQHEDFLDHKDEKRKENFHTRFKNNKGINDPESGLYWSSRLLW